MQLTYYVVDLLYTVEFIALISPNRKIAESNEFE